MITVPRRLGCSLLAPFITLLVNTRHTSLSTGCFPVKFKQAVIAPLLKKCAVDSSRLQKLHADVRSITHSQAGGESGGS